MKQKLQQISFIGNFYILVFALGMLFNNELLDNSALIILLITILWAISLLVKPSKKLENLLKTYPKTAIFLSHIGWCAYLILPVYIMGFVDGYRTTTANYSEENFELLFPREYYDYYAIMCLSLFIFSLICGIYRCLKKS